ncbi:hypothetical protein GCM10022268_02450 [Sphingomonas cynarae]|uniref:DUF2163 domain-containing protein n=1 Tax=Sphingomonas cynarae TaxID=930197 RepID=A0ABP7CWI2_9SPHN
MSWLDAELATVALCWRIERRDGVAIGLTAHHRDLDIDGLIHRAAPGMVPSAVRREIGLEADTMEVAGALDGAAIDGRDLLAGRWDGARVAVFAVDWTGGASRVDLGEGVIGAVEMADGRFSAELTGPGAALDRRRWRTPRPNVAPRWATGGAGWRWRRGGGSRGWCRQTARRWCWMPKNRWRMAGAAARCAGSAVRMAGWRAPSPDRRGRW